MKLVSVFCPPDSASPGSFFRWVWPFLLVALVPLSAPAVWQLTWSDEFNGPTIDGRKWAFETGNNNGWGNSEREYYTGRTNNAFVADGVLHIVARQELTNGFPYTSARMKTQGLYSHTYGRIEWRAKLPQGLGYWPALWLLGNNINSVGWPACGEIDVMESKGSWSSQVQGTLHYSDAGNNHLQQTRIYPLPTPGDSTTNFHTYAIEWATNSIKWLVDSNVIQTWTSWSSSTGPYPAPYNQPYFLLMNVAVGGNYVGNPSDAQINSGTTFPGEMQVDYVRVYDDVPASSPPAAPARVSVSQGGGKAYLSWEAADSGVTGFNIKRASASGGPYTLIGTSGISNFIDSTASSCSTNYYVITATNTFGESTNSAEVNTVPAPFSIAINSGGTATNQFLADGSFSGGTAAAPVTATIDTSGVTAPAPQAVYQTERYGNFSYALSGLSPGLTYKVRLHFAETYWTTTGQRVFNVFINGAQVLTNFDIIGAAGAPNKANIQEFDVEPSGGQITIQYLTVIDNAKSSGIEVLLPPPPAPAAANNGPAYETGTLSLSASSVPSASYSWTGPNGFTSTVQNPTISNLTTGASGIYTVRAVVPGGCYSPPATTAVTVLPRPSLSYSASGTSLNLSWTTGTLQSATNVSGPWFDVSASGSTNLKPELPQQFFRLRAP